MGYIYQLHFKMPEIGNHQYAPEQMNDKLWYIHTMEYYLKIKLKKK